MSNRPYSIRRARLVPDLDDPNLYGAWGMVPQGGLLVDHTPQGNDGTPGAASCVEQTLLGPMRRYLPNSGVGASAMGAAGAFALANFTLSFWVRSDLGAGNHYLVHNYQNLNDQWGVRMLAGGTSLQIFDDIDNAGTTRYSTVLTLGRLYHIVAEISANENLLWLDNVLIGSGESSSASWDSYTGTLYHGGQTATALPTIGILSPMLIHNAAKDQAWVTKEYEKGAKACQFKTDWGVKQSIGNEVAPVRVGANSSPFEIISGTFQMSMDTPDSIDAKVIEDIAAGACTLDNKLFDATPTEAAFGTFDFWAYKGGAGNDLRIGIISSDNDLVTGATQNGYRLTLRNDEGIRLRRITNGASAAILIQSAAGYITNGTWYRFRLTRDYAGVFVLYIRGGAYTDWTTVGTSAPDLTYTTSNYTVWDIDAGDKFAYASQKGDYCFSKFLGVLAP